MTTQPSPGGPPPDRGADALAAVLQQVDDDAAKWRFSPAVSISQAAKLTGLNEGQIRYFERLGAVQPASGGTSREHGARREYALADLRRLRTLAVLLQNNWRAKEAVAFVLAHAPQIDRPQLTDLPGALSREEDARADAFLLTRLLAHLLLVAERELAPASQPKTYAPLKVLGVLLPGAPHQPSTPAAAAALGRRLAGQPGVPAFLERAALDTVAGAPGPLDLPEARLRETGQATPAPVLLLGGEEWTFPERDTCAYCFYTPAKADAASVVFLVTPAAGVPPTLPVGDGCLVLDQLLAFCERLLPAVRRPPFPDQGRYIADGAPITQSIRLYKRVLQQILGNLFPADADAHGALLVPDKLMPTNVEPRGELIMLATHNYEQLKFRPYLILGSNKTGLTTRAFETGEPYFTLDVPHDNRVAYRHEERSRAALAIPLLATAALRPVGVLYLATSRPWPDAGSRLAYVALLIGNVLAEHLTQWWLLRERKARDAALQEKMPAYLRWLDAMDPHGYDLERAYAQLEAIWGKARKLLDRPHTAADVSTSMAPLSLVVLDIDRHDKVQGVQPRLSILQAQDHVNEAIVAVASSERRSGIENFWFKNDHTILILDEFNAQQAMALTRRIMGQVYHRSLISKTGEQPLTISVSAALETLTHLDFAGLAATPADLRVQLHEKVDGLHAATSPVLDEEGREQSTISQRTPAGWQRTPFDPESW